VSNPKTNVHLVGTSIVHDESGTRLGLITHYEDGGTIQVGYLFDYRSLELRFDLAGALTGCRVLGASDIPRDRIDQEDAAVKVAGK